MRKIAFVTVAGYGHVNPVLASISELRSLGVDVLAYSAEAFRPSLEAAGARFKPVTTEFGKNPPPLGLKPEELMALFFPRLAADCRMVATEILPDLEKERPDLVVYDNFSLGGRLAAQILKLPAAAFFCSYASNHEFSLFRNSHSPEAMQSEPVTSFLKTVNELTSAHGLPAFTVKDVFQHSAPLNLVFMPRAFQPKGDTFDSTYRFVGPQIAPRPVAESLSPAVLEKRPILYISLGTVFNTWPEFFSLCFEAFAGNKWNVIMAVGQFNDLSALAGAAPKNFTVLPHAPQLEILPRANAFITHAGMNSTMESLSNGVPMVAIPQMEEQMVTAVRIAELGLGAHLKREEVSSESLLREVERISSDEKIRENVGRMREAVLSTGGYRETAQALLEMVK